MIAAFVDQTVLVSDEEIRTAQRVLWDRLRIVAEPGGATAFAALLSGRYHLPQPAESSALVVVISGANTTAVDHDRA